jgi:membrane-bound metal-dependent hydrolase YbcI (DUF457 family)
LSAVRSRISKGFWTWALASSIVIDIDHLPGELGSSFLDRGAMRPYSHSLITVALLVALGLRWRQYRRQILAAATGVAFHLLRDTGTGGTPLAWPAVRDVGLPYEVYAGILLGLAAPRTLIPLIARSSSRMGRKGQLPSDSGNPVGGRSGSSESTGYDTETDRRSGTG